LDRSQGSSDTAVYNNPDGSHTARVHGLPTFYQAGNAWTPIDTSITPDSAGYSNKAGPVNINFSSSSTAQLVSVDDAAGGIVAFSLAGANAGVAAAAGSTITYPAILNGTNLQYQLGKDTLKELLILAQSPSLSQAPTHYEFPMTLTGLTPHANPDGSISITDPGGTEVYRIPMGTMWDSHVDPLSGIPAYGAVHTSLIQDQRGWVVVLDADRTWLDDPARTYPVFIDPTLYFGAGRSGGGDDAFITDAAPNSNFNVFWSSAQGRYINRLGYYDTGTGTNRSYLHYDTSFLNGRHILSAQWVGYFSWSYYATTRTNYYIYPITSWWNAGSVTWNGQPSQAGAVVQDQAVRGDWRAPDITSTVANWASGAWPNYGLALDTNGEGTGSWKNISADENSDGSASYLQITYNTPPSVASPSAPSNGSSFHNFTPTLSASASDADGDPIQYYFRVALNSDAETNVVYNSGWVSSTSVTLPAGLPQNRTYYWHAYSDDGVDMTTPNYIWSFTPTNIQPSQPIAASPADQAVVPTSTPQLIINPSTDADGDPISYTYRIATGPDGQTGLLVDSGKVTQTTWSPPTGALSDGGTYYWTAQATDGYDPSALSIVRKFTVELGLGDKPSRPYDRLGPVAVNLANGNVMVSTASPSFMTVGGSIGLSYTYNSRQPSNQGLTGYYFNDLKSNHQFDPNQGASVVRVDSQLTFDWNTSSPYPSIGKTEYLARWTGYVTAPVAGSYRFGTKADDGSRVWINNSLVLDHWVDQSAPATPNYGTAVTLGAGETVPIKVEYYQNQGGAHIELWTNGPVGVNNAVVDAPVPASWFTTDVPGLPDGWSLSADPGNSLSYTAAKISDKNVSIVDSSGATHVFKWTGSAWAPPAGEDAVLTNDASAGLLVLHAEDGKVYSFNSNGTLAAVAAALDDRSPAAPTYTITGSPALLTKITDPVSGKAIPMTYGGDPSCPSDSGFSVAPNFMLCKVDYAQFGGGQTSLYYSNGHLARITDPGGEITDLGYDATGLLTQIRDPLTNDLITSGTITDPIADSHKWLIAYAGGKAIGLTSPVPDGGALTIRPQHTYDYWGSATNVHVAGIVESALGYVRQVTEDSGGRLSEDRDLAGKLTKYEWDSGDRLKKKTDPTGITSTTIYDAAGRPTDQYGPGAASEFAADYTSATAPHSSTAYDEAMTGLGAAWWDQTGLAGSPKAHTTFPSWQDWGSGSPAPNIPAPGFSGRFTGEVNVTTPGTYGFSSDVGSDNGVRVYIDDWRVIDRWDNYKRSVLKDLPTAYWRLGDATSSTAAADAAGSSPGAYNGGVTRGISGALASDGDTAATFDGATGSNVTANNVSLPTAGATMEAWVNLPDTSRSGAFIQVGAGGNGFGLGVGSGRYDSSTPGNHLIVLYETVRWIDSGVSIGIGWHHVAATIDGSGTATFFIDGAQVAQSTGSAPLAHGSNVALGGYTAADSSQRWFHGTLDEAAVYGQALPPPSIAAHDQAGNAKLTLDPYKTAVLADSPVTYYQLADSSGTVAHSEVSGTDGTYNNSPSLAQVGKIAASGAVVLNGSNQYMVTPNLGSALPNDTVTVESWFRADGPGVLVDELGTSAPSTAPFHNSQVEVLAGGEVRVRVWNLPWISVGTIGFGTWHHVALRYDQGTQQLQGFLDGARSDTSSTGSPSTGDRATPGESGYGTYYALGAADTTNLGSGAWFKGAVDEFAVYNQALTDRQLQAHYLAGAAKYTGGTTQLTPGMHRIRIDYQNPAGPAKVFLNWTPPGGTSVAIPATSLKPRYGLVTTTIGADGKKTKSEYASPELGLATAEVVDPDPGGLNLRSTTTYEAVGSGFLRKTSRTLPKGASTTVSYAYYGATEVADNPCPGGATGINQAGLLKTSTSADPDGSGPQTGIVRESRYDLAGKVVASRVVGDSNWACTSYDSRERVVSEQDSSGKTTTYDYSTPAVVLTTSPDSSGATHTTTAKADWLGRTLSYTDENGTISRMAFDQAGRVTDTYRQFSAQNELQLTHVAYDSTTGREASITEYASGTGRTSNFTYDDAGRLLTLIRPNGVVTTNTFDPNRGWLNAISNKNSGGTELSPWTYVRSPSGDIQSETTTGRTRAFQYDAAGRLTQASEGAAVRNYSYDANSNRCSTTASCDGSYQYDNADRLLSSPFSTSYVYDSHGNLTSATPTAQAPAGSLNQNFSTSSYSLANSDGVTWQEMDPTQLRVTASPLANQSTLLIANTDLFTVAPGFLRVASSPALPTQILVDGQIADAWGLNWVKEAPGNHTVCFTHVEGWTEPACQTVAVTTGNTTTVTGTFTQRGSLRVITTPAVASQISVDGNPTDESSMWTDVPTGAHTVCFGAVANFDPPACQTATVTAGTQTTITGTFTSNPLAPAQSGMGWLRTATAPPVASQITIKPSAGNPYIADSWGLSWLELAPGSYTVSFRHVPGYTEPAPQVVTIAAGATTVVPATFTERGTLRVLTSPAVGGTIVVDGVPRDDWGMWTDIPTGSHTVCFGAAAGYHPPACQTATITAGVETDLTGIYSTGNIGVNQDLGIFVSDNGGADTLVAWKESGGNGGPSSPDAATVQALYSTTSGHTYVFKLKWKTNTPAAGTTIYAGAGPITGQFSPTSLVAETFPHGVVPNFAVSTNQYTLTNSDGSAWQTMDAANLATTLSPGSNSTAVLGASADLSTSVAGYSQDLGIFVSDNGGADTLVAWKESGGNGGTSSPNATFVKATYAMIGGHSYVFKLRWKTAVSASGANIYAGAGPIASQFSPTSLLAETITSGVNPYAAASSSQYMLSNSDGATWQTVDPALNLSVNGSDNTYAFVGANADLWTATAGYNQDIGIFVSDNGGADTLVAWQESSGASTSSPNAAFAQAAYLMATGHTYVFKLKWKTNTPAAGTIIYAGAGPIAGQFSPTRLTVELTSRGIAKEVIAYDGNDHATSIDDGTNTTAETLAPSGRVLKRVVTDDITAAVREDTTFGYDGAGDSPTYSRPTSGGVVTTYVEGPGGLLVIDAGGTPAFPITNGHSDVVGNTDVNGTFTANPTTDEFGLGQAPANRLGWLGGKERFSTGGSLGLVRMGVRLYDPSLGRFLEVDTVEGGSANDYDYVNQDPVNDFDLAGTFGWGGAWNWVTHHGGAVIGAVATWGGPASRAAWGAVSVGRWGYAAPIAAVVLGLWPHDAGEAGPNSNFHYAKPHTQGARPSTWNKHSKPRPGRLNEKKKVKPAWRPNPNKRPRQ
jgi:RHS repeat-associated protein